jgi:sugar lactone lactonase YvrE
MRLFARIPSAAVFRAVLLAGFLHALPASAFIYQGFFGQRGSNQPGAFEGVVHLSVDTVGDVWVSNFGGGLSRIQQFSPTGSYISLIKQTGLDVPLAIAFSPDNYLYVLHEGGGRGTIWKLNRAGTRVLAFGGHNNTYNDINGKFRSPTALAVDGNGNVYVCETDGFVTKFSSSGVFLAKWRIASPLRAGSYAHFTSITVGSGPSNSYVLYATDIASNCVVKLNTTTGSVLQRFGSSGKGNGQLDDPQAVVVDRNGLVYVGDYANQRVMVFEPDGSFAFAFNGASNFSTGAKLYHVDGLAFSPAGDVLYVLTSQSAIIQRYKIY